MSRSFLDLDPRFRDIAQSIRFKFEEKTGKSLAIIDTLRTQHEQDLAILHGTSWTKNSKHLPQPPLGLSLAVDFCPIEYLTKKYWNPTGALWWVLANLVKDNKANLISGMDWHNAGLPPVGKTRSQWDPGHIHLIVDVPSVIKLEQGEIIT